MAKTERIERNKGGVESGAFVSRRMVIKIGSSSITQGGNPLNLECMYTIAKQVAVLFYAGVEVVIVSSGAVESGKRIINTNGDMVHKQTAAMYGQNKLMNGWDSAFARYNIPVAGLLLTKQTLKKSKAPLIDAMKSGITIINENDAVNNEELKKLLILGDNDKLASRVARKLIHADTLLLLTDTDGVLDIDGNIVADLDKSGKERILYVAKKEKKNNGMESKVKAGFKAAKKGIRVVIANAREEDVILNAARGKRVGTSLVA